MEKNANPSHETIKVRDHLANERTFLAWSRTSLGIMAFGFVVEKFSLFIRKMASLLHDPNLSHAHSIPEGSSSIFGIVLIAIGATMCALAFWKFKQVQRQIIEYTYQPSSTLNVILTFLIILTGALLVLYLVISF